MKKGPVYRNGQEVKYKDGVLKYDKTIGWVFTKPGEKYMTVMYAYELKDVYKILK
jgi:hypothetical protein